MAQHEEIVRVKIAGHDMKMTATEDERHHIERAANKVNDAMEKLQVKFGETASPAKLSLMATFQFAYELSMADEMLEDAQRLHDELQSQREAVKRLESLLVRVDDALAY
jgi:cell division protein ZapA (FtsZ GTPase activity inhibitor)